MVSVVLSRPACESDAAGGSDITGITGMAEDIVLLAVAGISGSAARLAAAAVPTGFKQLVSDSDCSGAIGAGIGSTC